MTQPVNLRERHGVRTRALVADLGAPDAAEQVLHAIADLDLGVAVYNAAAESDGPFAESALDPLRLNVAVNVWTPTALAHGLGNRFIQRGRGALALVSSMGALAGIARFAAYGAAKAYELILAEGLWDEWRPHGVDALGYVVGATARFGWRPAEPGLIADLDQGHHFLVRS
jgi:short-subunit dehydrogenase